MEIYTERICAQRFEQGRLVDFEDVVLVEKSLKLFLNEDLLLCFTCTGKDIKELIVGRLFCDEVIQSISDILSIVIDNEAEAVHVTTSVKKNTLPQTIESPSNAILEPDYPLVISAFDRFQELSTLFKDTGAVHSAALLDIEYNFCYFYEDMGRHNAVDKVIGKALLDGFPISRSMLMTSSRMPLELIKKAGRAGIPAVMSISAPTAQSINFAKENNITLIGMFRNKRINIYNQRSSQL